MEKEKKVEKCFTHRILFSVASLVKAQLQNTTMNSMCVGLRHTHATSVYQRECWYSLWSYHYKKNEFYIFIHFFLRANEIQLALHIPSRAPIFPSIKRFGVKDGGVHMNLYTGQSNCCRYWVCVAYLPTTPSPPPTYLFFAHTWW